MNFRSALPLVVLACGCAPQLGSASSAIVGGVDTSDEPAVVMTLAHQDGSMQATICTGIVISPHVVLTAAHCVSTDNVGANAIFNIYEGGNLNVASSSDLLPVSSVDANPQYKASAFSQGYDLGVVVATNPLVPTPLSLNRRALSQSLVGQAATLIGYGERGADMSHTAGVKREVTSTLVSFDDKFDRFGMEGATACEGDSGGPALMDIDGVTTIMGIVSFGDPTCTQPVTYSRVDAYLKWIDDEVESADPGYFTDLSMPKHGGCDLTPRARPPWLAIALALVGLALVRRSRARDSR